MRSLEVTAKCAPSGETASEVGRAFDLASSYRCVSVL